MAEDKEQFNPADVMADANKLAQRMGLEGNKNHWFGKEISSGTHKIISPLWLAGNGYVQARYGDALKNMIGEGLKKAGTDSWLPEKSPKFLRTIITNPKYATAGVFGLVAASPLLPTFLSPFKKWHTHRSEMAKHLAPVLQDMKAEGLPDTIGGIGLGDNEIIFAEKERANSNLKHFFTNNALNLASTQLPGAINAFTGTKKNLSQKQIEQMAAQGDLSGVMMIASGSVEALVNEHIASRDKQLASSRNACSAYELIVQLNQELLNFKGDAQAMLKEEFAYPRKLGNSGQKLEHYIYNIIKEHAAEMARMMPGDYSPIRSGLQQELKDVSKILAEAIANGDLPPMQLVRLVGEGHIIKNNGRGLVDATDLQDKIETQRGNIRTYTDIKPEEYMKMAAFTEKELAGVIQSATGQEREILISMLPDKVLNKVGVKADEITEVRQKIAPHYEKALANLLLGLAVQGEDALKEQGLSHSEIKEIMDAANTIEAKGNKAVHSMRANATRPIGIEHTIINAAMPHISEGNYLGKMIEEGRARLSDADSSKAANDHHFTQDDLTNRRDAHKEHTTREVRGKYTEHLTKRDHAAREAANHK